MLRPELEQAIRTRLEARMGRLIASLREGHSYRFVLLAEHGVASPIGGATIAEWAGAPEYHRAFLIRKGKRYSVAVNVRGIGDPDHPPFAKRLEHMNAALDSEIKGADEAHDLTKESAASMAKRLEEDAEGLINYTAGSIAGAVGFYVDPALVEEVIGLRNPLRYGGEEDLTIADLWPWEPLGRPVPLVLDWLRDVQNGGSRVDALGHKLVDANPNNVNIRPPELIDWMDAAKQRALATSREPEWLTKERDRQIELRRELRDRREGDRADEEITNDVTDWLRRLCFVWSPNSPEGWTVSPDGVGVLYQAERQVRARVRQDAELAARIARRNLDGYASDPAFVSARKWFALDVMKGERDRAESGDPAHINHAPAELEDTLRRELEHLAERLADQGDDPTAWDEAFAAFLEAFSETGQEGATQVRARSEQRRKQTAIAGEEALPGEAWGLWADTRGLTGRSFVTRLARVLWASVVRAKVERSQRRYPATVIDLAENRASLAARESVVEETNGQLVLRAGDETVLRAAVAAMPADVAEMLATRSAGALRSVAASDAIRWLLWTGHRREWEGESDARRIAIEGGFGDVAEKIGLVESGAPTKRKEKRGAEVRAVLEALAHWKWTLPDGSDGNMIVLRHRPARGRRRGQVEIVLGTPWMPGYVHELKAGGSNTLEARERRRLVPTLSQRPPTIGRANEAAALVALADLIVIELRRRAAEVATHGGARIGEKHIDQLADQLGIPRELARRQTKAWVDDPEGILEQTKGGRITLAEAEQGARDFIAEAGKDELDGRKWGRRKGQKGAPKAKRRRQAVAK